MEENIKIDKKSKVLFIVLLILIFISIGATYYRAMIAKDFKIFYDETGGV